MFTRLGLFVLWLLHFLPLGVQAAIGNAVGIIVCVLAGERRNVATINLKLCFPHMSETERSALVRRHFQVFTRSFIERGIIWWSSAERINRFVHVEGEEYFNAVLGKPVVILIPHFVGLDVAGQWIAQRVDATSMYALQKNKYLNDFILGKRARFGNQRLYSRQEGLRPVIKSLRENRPFFYLPDQDQTAKDGAFIPFFGVPAATMTSVPRIAKMTGAVILPCTTRILPGDAGYVLKFYPTWENYPTGDDIADTRRMNAFIEECVVEMPEQYFWLHKRFKTRPEGEERFYD
jgi:Kdo2-lipid IVA lauroyltransferase/acyltransferase